MQDFEKLGAFYLGKRHDTEADELTDEVVLYDSKDLTTHAVDYRHDGLGQDRASASAYWKKPPSINIPVIAIDPKGDMGNLLLTFPKLRCRKTSAPG